MNITIILASILLIIAAAVFVLAVFFTVKIQSKGRITRALSLSLFLITLPKKVKQENKEEQKKDKEVIAVMEQLYASLSYLKSKKGAFKYGRPYMVFEIATPETGEEIAFYLAVPKSYENVIEKQIHGFYPEASVQKTPDYNIFNPNGAATGSYLKLARSYVLPIKTYQNLETDPLNQITNTLSKLAEKGEGAAIQIVFCPAVAKWQKMGLKIAREMQKGKDYDQARAAAKKGIAGKTLDAFVKAMDSSKKEGSSPKPEEQKPVTGGQEEIIKALENKASKLGFETNIRLMASADSQQRAQEILNQIESSFVQFNAPNLNNFKACRVKGKALKKLIFQYAFRLFSQKQSSILCAEELTSILHFPTAYTETPKLKFLKAELAGPPANLPKEGLILGKNIYRGQEAIVRLQRNDRRRHLYIIGQTGTGKSNLMRNLIIQDIQNKEGICLIDPHGDFVESILGFIPKDRAEDVILLDPSDLERPLGLNLLEYNPKYPEHKTFIINELISIFDKLYDLKTTGGPMFEQYTRNALQLLMDDPSDRYTLMEVPRVMADAEFRRGLLDKCQNIVTKDFWIKEAEKAGGESSLANIVPYVTSKFNVFIANDYMRPIIGQSQSSINFRQIMDQKKILLVNLSKGRLGDINSSLLGLIVTGKLLMATFTRTDVPEEQRHDFFLYMDEFQNFATDSISTILSEARKYRLCLTVAHQFIGQLEEKIRDAVFGNVGSMVAFRIGADDAEFLDKQFAPIFSQSDLLNIDNYNAYIKLLIEGKTSLPFSILVDPPQQENIEIAYIIKELSRLKYGRDRKTVDQEILARYRLSQPVNAAPFIDSTVK